MASKDNRQAGEKGAQRVPMVIESKIDKFIGKVELGVEFFNEAGKLLVEMVGEDPHVFERIEKHTGLGWMTRDVLKTFEMIGEGKLAVETLFLPQHVVNHMIGLPLDRQIEIANRPVPVFCGTRFGVHRTDCKPAKVLSRRDAALAIGPRGLRTPEEQAEFERNAKLVKSVGRFTVKMENGSVSASRSSKHGESVKVVLDESGTAEVEFLQKV